MKTLSARNFSAKILFTILIAFSTAGALLAQPPAVTTDAVTAITTISATCGGIVTDDFSNPVTVRGVCWSTISLPTTSDNITLNGAGLGSFTSLLTGLVPGTTYYVRAYATNIYGTSYGVEMSFTTPQLQFTQPLMSTQVTTGQVYSIVLNNLAAALYAADAGIFLSADGGSTWTPVGYIWDINAGTNTIPWPVDLATPASPNCLLSVSSFEFDLNWQYFTVSDTFEIIAAPPGITVNQPAIGAFWQGGTMHSIEWISANVNQDEIIQFSDDGGSSWTNIDTIYGANNGQNIYNWTVPAVTGINSNAIIRVISWDLAIEGSSGIFSLSETPQLSFGQPAIAVQWTTAQTWQIEINNQGGVVFNPAAYIFLSTDGGSVWDTLFSLPNLNPGLNTINWPIDLATVASASCKLAFSLYIDFLPNPSWEFHTESEIFEIIPAPASITVSQPTAGAIWLSGEMNNLEWMSVNVFQSEKIQYSIDGGTTWIESDTIWAPVNGANTYSWTVPYVAGYNDNAMIRVTPWNEVVSGSSQVITLSNIITMPVSFITQTTAESGGNVTHDGGSSITDRGVCWSTSINPTIADSYTSFGPGMEAYPSSLTGLIANTKYYVRAYATDGAVYVYGNEISFNTMGEGGAVGDVDGNTYNTIVIGTQTWMAENLKTRKYNNGIGIPLVTDNAAWAALSSPGYSWNNNDSATNNASYGILYNWETVNTGNLCPAGWHVPTDAEWTVLTDYLGGESVAGGKLKETGITHWLAPNTDATNETGFTAVPGNFRNSNGTFNSPGGSGFWWSSTEQNTFDAFGRTIDYDFGSVNRSGFFKPYGFSVRCLKDSAPTIVLPTLTTQGITSITPTTATSGGDITSDGGAPVTERGVCWSTAANPTFADTKTTDGTGTGVFPSSITGLTAGTFYYVRAYAINSVDTAYGNEISFTTLAVPVLTTTVASSITISAATSGGNVISDGGYPVTEYGICWNTLSNPTIADNKTSDGTGMGTFSSSLTGLIPGATYYVRAYATNSNGTSYGDEVSFTTPAIGYGYQGGVIAYVLQPGDPGYLPGETQGLIASLVNQSTGMVWWNGSFTTTGATSASLGTGNANTIAIVSNQGEGNYAAKLCYDLVLDGYSDWYLPSIDELNKLYVNKDVLGSFASLNYWSSSEYDGTYAKVQYFGSDIQDNYGKDGAHWVRAVRSYTTLTTIPTLITEAASSITANTVTTGGNVTGDGGSAVTAYGVCWSTIPNPTTSDNTTIDGTGTGTFTSSLTGLTPGTTYYVRAYAINSVDTAYGNEVSFTTYAANAISDIDGNYYNIVTIGTQEWMAENLKTTKFNNGLDIPMVTDDGIWSALTNPGFCWYNNDSATNNATYGALYNWYTLISGNLCPTGWHVPSDFEWTELSTYLGGNNLAGGKLKETGLTHWLAPNAGATNETGFTALPGGFRYDNGIFEALGTYGDWWTSTESNSSNAWIRDIDYSTSYALRYNFPKNDGFSVRCLKDSAPTLTTQTPTSINSTTATSGGYITSDGGAAVTERGVCWSTAPTPTFTDSKTTDGPGTGIFTSSITGLAEGTLYYVRAYAINSVDTAYGNEVSFTTLALPVLSTTAASSVTSTTATSGGDITSDGGANVTERGVCWSTSANPTYADNKTSDGTGTGVFISSTTGLTAGTMYYVRAYAINSVDTAYGNEVSFTTYAANAISDIEGNYYNIVAIGTQEWMAENLKTTKFNNGLDIPLVTDIGIWAALTNPGFCWYNNDSATNNATYGVLYNWYTVNTGNLCPADWHIPTDSEWTVLTDYLGGETVAGGKLKEAGFSHWNSPNTSATNETGFTALPGGTVNDNGIFNDVGYSSGWWSNTEYDANYAWDRYMGFDYGLVGRFYYSKQYGISVRCIKDSAPTLTTQTPTSITPTTATSGGDITSDGGAPVTERGVCWSTSSYPGFMDSKTTDGPGTGVFASSITGLTEGTTYNVRAYAINSVDTAYGNEVSFTTYAANAISDIEGNYYNIVTIGTQEWMAENLKTTKFNNDLDIPLVTDNGVWSALSNPGFCWYNNDSASYNADYGILYNWFAINSGNLCPTGWHVPSNAEWTLLTDYLGGENVAAGKMKETGTIHWNSPNIDATNESGFTALPGGVRYVDGVFYYQGTNADFWSSSEINSTESYYRNMDLNSGIINSYTDNKVIGFSVRCLKDSAPTIVLPTLTTQTPNSITPTSATSGGDITSDGGAAVTERGVCWSTAPNPTFTDSKTTDGPGSGVFVSSIMGLTEGTIYYVRAYAINSVDTAYGNEVSFTTLALPVLSTTAASSVTSTTATSGGDITSDGGANVTERGVCWSTSPNPTFTDSKTTDGTGTGIFVSSITGLTAGTLYYVRAYAINNVDTAYGNEVSFTTYAANAITDIDGNYYNIVTIGTQEWMAENLKTTKYSNGDLIGTTTPDTLDISGETEPTYQWAYDGNESLVNPYGRLYTWYAATDSRNVCPASWHLPSDAEWTELGDYLGGLSIAGGKLKETGTIHWTDPNTGATNETGFSALPGGLHEGNGSFWSVGYLGFCWSATVYNSENAWSWYLNNSSSALYRDYDIKARGFSVRCLRDSAPTLTTQTPTSITPTTATSGGDITSDGGAAVTGRGVCWSTTTNPTLADNFTNDVVGVGLFPSFITGLTPATTYYVRAYATNSVGTAYGNELLFTTQTLSVAVIKKASIAPIIDGLADTVWNNANVYNIDKPFGIETPTLGVSGTTTWKGLWTDNGIYLLLEVNDDVFSPAYAGTSPATWWMYDNPEIYFDVNTVLVDGLGASNNLGHYQVAPTFINGQIDGTPAMDGYGVVNAFLVTDPTYVAEYYIPFTKLLDKDGTEVSKTATIGFDITLDDNDVVDPTRNRAVWSNTGTINESWNNMDGCGTFTLEPAPATPITDIDGNIYNTVNIGTQTWMAENLKTTKLSDGTAISLVTDNVDWSLLSTLGYSWYMNDEATYKPLYGALYNWYTINSGILCPSGWHVPSDSEWIILTDYLGGIGVAGGKLKEAGISNWYSPNIGATNETGFTGLPGGSRDSVGGFGSGGGADGVWWSNQESNISSAWSRILSYDYSGVYVYSGSKQAGFSVRCLMNSAPVNTIPTLTTQNITSITPTTAISGGDITDNGGAGLTARGVCWSTTTNPSLADSFTADGVGVGIFPSYITGLTPATTYYVRAYATNSVGTAYGNELNFTTLPPDPNLITNGGFEADITGSSNATDWYFYIMPDGSNATFTIVSDAHTGSNALQSDVALSGSAVFNSVQVYRHPPNIIIPNAGTYSLSFWAKANAANQFEVLLERGDWESLLARIIVPSFTTGWQQYSVNFHIPEPDTCTLQCWLQTSGTYWLDDFEIVEVPSGFANGQGSFSDPYQIATPEDLNKIRDFCGPGYSGVYFRQTANIDLGVAPWNQAEGWEPIGNTTNQFFGNFDGGGFTISGLTINRPATTYVGLFGWAREGVLTNIGLVNVDITGNMRIGALAGKVDNNGYVGNCYSNGVVKGLKVIGGLLGNLYYGATMENCYSSVNVRMLLDPTGNQQAGGLVSRASFSSFVNNCFATGNVEGMGSWAGGFVSLVTNNSIITNSYATGEVSGNSFVGGFIGSLQPGSLINCYAVGKVSSSDQHGGFSADSIGGNIAGSYWNTETSGQENSMGGEAINTLQMISQSTFDGWAFDTIWSISEGSSYPYLQWQISPEAFNYPPTIISPSNFTVTPGTGSTSLSWQAPSIGNVTGYNIYRDSSIIGTVASLGFTDGGLSNYVTYTYFVTALYNTDESEPSNSVSLFLHTGFAGGDGSVINPYLISNAGELFTTRLFLSSNFRQVANIDLGIAPWNTGEGWKPIGLDFTGTYDGNGYTISNLTINRPLEGPVGLFRSILSSSSVANIILDNVNIIGNSAVGALAGWSGESNLTNISINGSISGNELVGGIVGSTSLLNLNNCHSSGTINSTGDKTGGLTGDLYENSNANNSYSSMIVSSTGNYTGGLFGTNELSSSVTNSYFLGSVSGNLYVGGITGQLNNGIVISCYSTGNVSGNSFTGGLIGNGINNGIITASYWNRETSGQSNSWGGEGRTSDEMTYTYGTNTYSGWDFTNIWADDAGNLVNNGYPFLRLLNVSIPSVVTDTIESLTGSWAKSGGNVNSDGGVTVTARGLCWNQNGRPTILNAHTNLGAGTGAFISYPAYLSPGTRYYLRAYATNSVGTAYGNELSFVTTATSQFAGGSGTQADPFLIATAEQLSNVRFYQGPENTGVYFLQTANIDLGVIPWNQLEGWEPIGREWNQFYGNYNGAGYTISGLTINRPEENYVGLFGFLKGSSLINIGLVNVDITGNQRVGALVGKIQDNGYVGNCYSTGNVKGQAWTAGLVANLYLGSTMDNCYSTANVQMIAGTSANYQAGGLVGRTYMNANLNNCFATGNVEGIGTHKGGLVGYSTNNSTITNSYATGKVTGDGQIGGLIGGLIQGTVTNCYSVGKVSGFTQVGGLVGYMDPAGTIVTSNYWNNETSGQASSAIGEAKNTPQMIASSTFVGWAFDTVWNINEGSSYPYLQWQTNAGDFNYPPAFLPPSNLAAVPGNGSVSLSWQAPTIGSVTLYNIYRDGSLAGTSPTVNFTDTGLTNFITHNYFVTALYGTDESESTPVVSLFSHGGFSGGDGSLGNPYLVSNAEELYIVRLYPGSHFRQIADIDLGAPRWSSGEGWEPIGSFANMFTVYYEGDGYIISNLTINRPTIDGVGLFGSIDNSFIDNLKLENVTIIARGYAGALAGDVNRSSLNHIGSNGTISGIDVIGGIVGDNWNSGLSNSHSAGTVNATGSRAGGLAGIVFINSSISNSFSNSTVTGMRAGGLTALVSNMSTITNSYFTGNVTGTYEVGGITSQVDSSSVVSCFSNGSVAGGGLAGGLVGSIIKNGIVITSYWNTETSGQVASVGGSGRTTDEMTFTYGPTTYEGWDFSGIWAEDAGYNANNGYPYLRNQVVAGTAASNSTICSGTSASMTLTGYSGSIQWQQSDDGITNWMNVLDGAGGNTDNYITGILASSTYYRAALTQPGYSTVYSNLIIVTVNPFPANAGLINGTASVCQGQNMVSYKVPAILNATSYVWTLPGGATGTSVVDSIMVDYGTSAISGNITVKGNNSCGDGTISTLAVIVNPLPADAPSISGNSIVCQGQIGETYTVSVIANASTYIWTLPIDASGTSASNNIMIGYSTSAVSGNITVKGNNACGDGSTSTLAVTVNPLPAVAGAITGMTTVCQGQNTVTYAVPAIANATSYVWTLPIGVTGTSTTDSITVNYGLSAASVDITVKGNNSCGDGIISALSVTVNPLPEFASAISGLTAVCQGQSAVTYSVPAIANATAYVWTIPTGATGTSTTNSITVDYGASAVSGNITVKGNNSCGDGATSSLAVTVNPLPAVAGAITGLATVCQGQAAVTYTVPVVTDATSYIWTLSSGATGTSLTNSISVDYGTSAVSGNITVKGNNSCGDGTTSNIAITVNPLPAVAGAITGLGTVCQGQTSVTYSIPAIANAVSYIWTLPTGATGSSLSNSISVNYGTSAVSGNITVKGNNSCGDGTTSTIAVTVNPLPAVAGVITGLATVCQGQNAVTYSVPAIANAVSYIWTLPTGATGSSLSNSISVNYGISAVSGNITVKGNNSCGNGTTSILAVTVNLKPATPVVTFNDKTLHSDAVEGNQWFDQGGIINGATNQDYSVTADGSYYDVVTLLGCSSGNSNIITKISECEARFNYSWNNVTGFTSFTDLSVGSPTGWSWNFGDGTSSKLKNPPHNYVKDGVYMVTLNILNEETGCISSVTREVIAISTITCESDFDVSINSSTGLAVFTSNSLNATDYYWDFGDGEFSIDSTSEHIYSNAGIYPVCLNIWNSANDCQSVSCKNVIYIPEGEKYIEADFAFFTSTDNNNVIFSDLSTSNTTSWYWTMGDGKVKTVKDPVYTYSKPGIYDVCLTVFDQINFLSNSVCKQIQVGTLPCNIGSDFTYFINPAALEVTFFNLSQGTVDNYFWDFGDGSTSAIENPSYQYLAAGYYEVELSVRNSVTNCMDEYSQFIQVGTVDCRAGFTYRVNPADLSVNFTDDSKGQIDYYYWDFGNGKFSVEPDPVQDYDDAGIYMVSQFVIDNTGSCIDNIVQPVQVGEVDCSADFVSYIDAPNYTAYFTNRNLGVSTALLWSFGDGSFSTQDKPVHIFPGEGIYSTGLNTYNFNNGCMDYYEEMLVIGAIGNDCSADFIYRVDPVNSEVTFANKSIGDIVETLWDFGEFDGENSLETDPVYTYIKGGYYNVCLTVTNSDGIKNMGCKWILIEGNAGNDCRASFMFTIDTVLMTAKFVDNSFGNIDRYAWDFGDNSPDSVSSATNPEHTYAADGFYLVQLQVENTATGCISNEYKLLNVADNQVLKAAFGYEAKEPDKKFAGYPVDLVSASSGDGATVEWDFGDKQLKKADGKFIIMDSTSRRVRHYYEKPGRYEVCLRISDPVRNISDVYCSFVYTKNPDNVEEINESGINLSVYPNPFIDFTTISYSIPNPDFIEIAIFDQLGRRIETLVKSNQDPGIYQMTWETKTVTTGVYHLKMITSEGIMTKQMVITR